MSVMSLSKVPLRPLLNRVLIIRLSSSSTSAYPKIQLQKPAGETGFFNYGRNLSRDKNAKGVVPQKGDLPMTFMLRRLGHAYEVYPLLVLTGLWFVLFCTAVYYSFVKIEIWLDRTHTKNPQDWERARQDYWKKATVFFDLDGRTHKRLEIMETLQDEMLEAAKKRGTR